MAMEPVKRLDSQVSQEVPVQEPPAPATATSSTPSTTDALTAYELDFLRPFRASSSRGASPTQKARTDQSWDDFLQALAAQYIELLDLDYGLQQELWSSDQLRSGFLALYFSAPHTLHYDPEQGPYQKPDLTKKRPFTDIQSIETPTLERQESQIKEAIWSHVAISPDHLFTNPQLFDRSL